MRKSAFTLIELLVVIAIIAILAAILFPVFAQAKQAAKKTGDLSNVKQLNTASQIYMTDYDDMMPVLFTRITGGVCSPVSSTTCGLRSMWQNHMYSYMKNWQILTAPDDPNFTAPDQVYSNISYGYNYGYLSVLCPINFGGNGCPLTDPGSPAAASFFIAKPATSVVRPAEIVMFADNGGKDFTSATILGSIVNVPDAWPSDHYFYGPVEVGWGDGCQNYFNATASGGLSKGKWEDTDGFAPRYGNGGNVSYVDGHAKFQQVGALAAGTNWNKNINCTTIAVTNAAKYAWDPRN